MFNSESHELKPDQIDWVKLTTSQVYALLEETPPDGINFSESVRNILKREEHWNAWKNEGCPAFKRPVPEGTAAGENNEEPRRTKRPRRKIGDVIKDAESVGKFHMGK